MPSPPRAQLAGGVGSAWQKDREPAAEDGGGGARDTHGLAIASDAAGAAAAGCVTAAATEAQAPEGAAAAALPTAVAAEAALPLSAAPFRPATGVPSRPMLDAASASVGLRGGVGAVHLAGGPPANAAATAAAASAGEQPTGDACVASECSSPPARLASSLPATLLAGEGANHRAGLSVAPAAGGADVPESGLRLCCGRASLGVAARHAAAGSGVTAPGVRA